MGTGSDPYSPICYVVRTSLVGWKLKALSSSLEQAINLYSSWRKGGQFTQMVRYWYTLCFLTATKEGLFSCKRVLVSPGNGVAAGSPTVPFLSFSLELPGSCMNLGISTSSHRNAQGFVQPQSHDSAEILMRGLTDGGHVGKGSVSPLQSSEVYFVKFSWVFMQLHCSWKVSTIGLS